MKDVNPFDTTLKLARYPREVHDAAVFVTDTLDLCWAAAQAVFEDKATPEAALAIFDRVNSRMQAQSSLISAPQVHGINSEE